MLNIGSSLFKLYKIKQATVFEARCTIQTESVWRVLASLAAWPRYI